MNTYNNLEYIFIIIFMLNLIRNTYTNFYAPFLVTNYIH